MMGPDRLQDGYLFGGPSGILGPGTGLVGLFPADTVGPEEGRVEGGEPLIGVRVALRFQRERVVFEDDEGKGAVGRQDDPSAVGREESVDDISDANGEGTAVCVGVVVWHHGGRLGRPRHGDGGHLSCLFLSARRRVVVPEIPENAENAENAEPIYFNPTEVSTSRVESSRVESSRVSWLLPRAQ